MKLGAIPGFPRVLIREIGRFDGVTADRWVACRNVLGLLVPVWLGIRLGSPSAGLVAGTSSLIVSLSDGDDPYASRARRLLVSCALCAAAVFFSTLTANVPALAVATVTAWAFAAGLSLVLGRTAVELGVFSLVMFIVLSDTRLTAGRALLISGFALAGGCVQAALALFLWTMRRYRPERRILSSLYVRLAALAQTSISSHDVPPASGEMSRAQSALSTLAGDRSRESIRCRFLLEHADLIRLKLVSLAITKKTMSGDERLGPAAEIFGAFSASAARVLNGIARALRTNAEETSAARAALADVAFYGERLRVLSSGIADRRSAAIAANAAVQMTTLSGRLRDAFEAAVGAAPDGVSIAHASERGRGRLRTLAGALSQIQSSFDIDSTGFRHALRLASAIALSEGARRLSPLHHSYWLPMTVALVLKPDYASTLSRGVLRIAGAIAGLIAATALLRGIAGSQLSQLVCLGGFAFLLRRAGGANYGIFTFAICGLIVMMSALAGVDSGARIWDSGVHSICGGLIAMFVYAVWPARGAERIAESLARMLDAYGAYFKLVVAELSEGGRDHGALVRSRGETRIRRANFQAAVAQYCAEPATTDAERELYAELAAASNQFIHSAMILDAAGGCALSAASRRSLGGFSDDVGEFIARLAGALRRDLRENEAYPDLDESRALLMREAEVPTEEAALIHDECERIVGSLAVIRERI